MRQHYTQQLQGIGLDIGPLHRPMVTHKGMKVFYVDRLPVSELRKHYPELGGLDLIEPDFLSDAETLQVFPNGIYDFVIASHVIEHMKNPLRALENWLRVIKSGGLIYLVAPDFREIFDKFRKETSVLHMLEDYDAPSKERDWEHYRDYAENVNRKFFGREIDPEQEAKRLLDSDYSIHFHCFTPWSLVTLIEESFLDDRVEIIQGPRADKEEFHLLLRKR